MSMDKFTTGVDWFVDSASQSFTIPEKEAQI
jgi:hypothetical protein